MCSKGMIDFLTEVGKVRNSYIGECNSLRSITEVMIRACQTKMFEDPMQDFEYHLQECSRQVQTIDEEFREQLSSLTGQCEASIAALVIEYGVKIS